MPEYFTEQKIFGLETNQTRRQQATGGERRAVQLAISQDVALRPGISRHEFVFESQFVDECPHGFGKSGTLGTRLKQQPISSDRRDYAPCFSGSLQNQRAHSQLSQPKCAGQSGDTGADHHCFAYVRHSM